MPVTARGAGTKFAPAFIAVDSAAAHRWQSSSDVSTVSMLRVCPCAASGRSSVLRFSSSASQARSSASSASFSAERAMAELPTAASARSLMRSATIVSAKGVVVSAEGVVVSAEGGGGCS